MDNLADICNTLLSLGTVDSSAPELDEESVRASVRAARQRDLSAAMFANREGLGMKVIAVMVQRYGVLCKELWDLNSESDMGAGRAVDYSLRVPTTVYERIISNTRYNITDLKIWKELTVMTVLPSTLQRLQLQWRDNSLTFLWPDSLLELNIISAGVITQPIVFPATLQKLKLNARFLHPVTLPGSLLSLYVGAAYQHPISLPSGLKELSFDPNSVFNEPLQLPDSLLAVTFSDRYNQPIVVPPAIKEMKFNPVFDQPITLTLPSSLQTAIFLGELVFSHPITFPPGMEELAWSRQYAGTLFLPEGLKKLTWGTRSETDDIEIPAGLKELVLTRTAQITLPAGLVKFSFSDDGNTHVDLPACVQHVTWYPDSNNTFTHPARLAHLVVSGPWYKVDLSKYKIDKVTIEIVSQRIERLYLPRSLKVLEILGGGPERTFVSTMDVPSKCRVIGGRILSFL